MTAELEKVVMNSDFAEAECLLPYVHQHFLHFIARRSIRRGHVWSSMAACSVLGVLWSTELVLKEVRCKEVLLGHQRVEITRGDDHLRSAQREGTLDGGCTFCLCHSEPLPFLFELL